MIYRTIWVSIYSFKCFKTVWSGLFTSTLFSPCSYRLDRNGMLLKFLRILITVMYFKDRNWISKTVNCISCSVVCKIVFCSEFPDIPDNAREEREGKEGEEEHGQLESVMPFTQTQHYKNSCYSWMNRTFAVCFSRLYVIVYRKKLRPLKN